MTSVIKGERGAQARRQARRGVPLSPRLERLARLGGGDASGRRGERRRGREATPLHSNGYGASLQKGPRLASRLSPKAIECSIALVSPFALITLFMTDIAEATMVMLSVIKNGGLAPGGFNFDAKLRRESTDVEDLFIAHIGGMDTLARGLRNAAKLIEDGSLAELVSKRYESFDSEIGRQIEAGKVDFEMLEKKAFEWGEPKVASAKQELAEMIFQSAL